MRLRLPKWRASVLASLLLIYTPQAAAEDFAPIEVRWQTDVGKEVRSAVESDLARHATGRFTESRLTGLIRSALSHLAEHGYHHAVISPGNLCLINDSVSLEFAVAPGLKTVIDHWEFAGAVRTDSTWLRHILDLPIGVVASGDVLRDAVARLRRVEVVSLSHPPEVFSVSDSTVGVRLTLAEKNAAQLEGALASGSGAGGGSALAGQISLGLDGLFRRDRSLRVAYEHPQPADRLFTLEYDDRQAISRFLSAGLQFEDWRRAEHRQRAAISTAMHPFRQQTLSFTVGGSWQKSTSVESTGVSTRIYEAAAGFSWGAIAPASLSARGVYSLHREWGTVGELSDARARLEVESSIRAGLLRVAPLELTVGARWWGAGAVVRTGDEWFLGGVMLRGYTPRSLAAKDGLWARAELARSGRSGLGAALFGELAWLTMFDGSYRRPASGGLAVLLASPDRSGRLEVSWRDHAVLSDGILRIAVTQGW